VLGCTPAFDQSFDQSFDQHLTSRLTSPSAQACKELGYTLDKMAEFLRPGGRYPPELLALVMRKTNCADEAKIRRVLDGQVRRFDRCLIGAWPAFDQGLTRSGAAASSTVYRC
jgi:hypothetical protein